MTPRQAETLSIVRNYWADHGYAPSYDEIREALKAKSKSSVASLVGCLVERGYLTKTKGLARSLRLTDKSPDTPDKIPEAPTDKEAVPWGQD